MEIGGAVLVAKSVAADHDGFGPTGHKAGDVLADDRLAEDHATEDVADGAVGRFPHLFQAKLLDPLFVGRDRRAFHCNADFLGHLGAVDGDLIVGAVALFDAEVIIQKVEIEIGQDQLFLDEIPDDPGHLVAVHLNNGIGHLDLGHGFALSVFGIRLGAFLADDRRYGKQCMRMYTEIIAESKPSRRMAPQSAIR